jgi:chemotaxis protein CheC
MFHHTLTPKQRNSLVGLEDLGMRGAARALADLLGEAPALTVASVGIIPLGAAASLVAPTEGIVAGVAFRLSGGTSGRFVVLLPRAAAFAMVASLSGRAVGRHPALTEEDLSILKEAGNILCSGYVSAMANRLGVSIMLSIPHLVFDRSDAVLAATLPQKGDGDVERALVVTRFADRARAIEGMLLLFPEQDIPCALGDGGARYRAADP